MQNTPSKTAPQTKKLFRNSAGEHTFLASAGELAMLFSDFVFLQVFVSLLFFAVLSLSLMLFDAIFSFTFLLFKAQLSQILLAAKTAQHIHQARIELATFRVRG